MKLHSALCWQVKQGRVQPATPGCDEPFTREGAAVFVRAADIYRKLRKQGITIRTTNDGIIAATALDHHCQLLHKDKDFASRQNTSP